MGYSTSFEGELRFASELTATQLAALNSMLGEDARDHPEWKVDPSTYLNYIDLELSSDFSGLKWSGAEKTYGLEEAVNVITREMRKTWPEFRITGQLLAQGESLEDRWVLHVDEEGKASKKEVVLTGRKITCPHCDEAFMLEDSAP